MKTTLAQPIGNTPNNSHINTNRQKRITASSVVLTLVLAMFFTFTGCGKSESSALVGKWRIKEGYNSVGYEMDLLKDGTGIAWGGLGIIWKVENGRFYYSLPDGRAEIWNYKISGTTITLTNDDGKTGTYEKQNLRNSKSAKSDADKAKTDPDNEKKICSERLHQIAIGFHNYHDSNRNAFPALYSVDGNGKPLHCWRVLLLPSVGETDLFKQIRLDEPWDSKHNSQFHGRVPGVYQCPGNKAIKGTANCTYSIIRDDKHCFPEGGKSLGFHSILDGTSHTVLLVEIKKPFCWMDPSADLTLDEFSKGINMRESRAGSYHPGGCNEALFDASVRFLVDTDDSAKIRAWGTRNGGESVTIP